MLLFLSAACFPRVEPDAPTDGTTLGGDSGITTPGAESQCGNGRDDDGDGDVDCDDADCEGKPACDDDTTNTHPFVETDCADGRDDDADGDTDCDDRDCDDDPACVDVCWDDDLGGALGYEIASGTASGNDAEGSCGGGGTPETILHWTAPSAGTYVFDTVGSTADTTLWVTSETCDGAELDCNTDTFGTDSQVTVDVSRGDDLVIGVEGNGAWVLSAWEGDCPEYSIGSELSVTGSTTSSTTDLSSSCGDVENAVTLRWVAPATGTYTFTTYGSTFDTIMALYDEGCEGEELTCNDDELTGVFTNSSATLHVSAGDVVAIGIGGYEGDTGTYLLTITN